MHYFQEVEPTIGEKLCRLWENVDGDKGILTGGRSGGIRGDHKHMGSSVHGPISMGGSSIPPPFSAAKGHPHMSPYPIHPMYFPPYGHSMPHSMYPGTSGSGDSRNQMGGMSTHPFFTHPPRLGYSSPPHLLPQPLHPMSGGSGGGPYSRPGRPWWTVPSFPPPSHLHLHPQHSSSHHHPPGVNYHDHELVQDEHISPSASPLDQTDPSETESSVLSATLAAPRTNSRNAYSQQRQTLLKKQQQQKEQSLKNGKKQDAGVRTAPRRSPFSTAPASEAGTLPKLTLLTKSRVADGMYSFANDETTAEPMMMKKRDEANFDSKKGLS